MRDWVELELTGELPPAKAPDELWDRVMYGNAGARVAARPARRPWIYSAALTVVTVMAFWFTLKHAQAAAFSCEPSPPVELTSAKVIRGHRLRLASFAPGAPESPHRGGSAIVDESCGNCHTAL